MLKNGNSDKGNRIFPLCSHFINALRGSSLFISHEISPNIKYIITRKKIKAKVSPFTAMPFCEPKRITKGISMDEINILKQKIIISSISALNVPSSIPYIMVSVLEYTSIWIRCDLFRTGGETLQKRLPFCFHRIQTAGLRSATAS